MQVLHVYSGNLFGGVETLLVTLARHQNSSENIRHHFALCFEGRLSKELQELGVRPVQLGKIRLSRPWTVWRARRRLKRLLCQNHYDLAIIHSCWMHTIAAPTIRRSKVPLVFWAHDSLFGRRFDERWASWTKPNLVIANSFFTRDLIQKNVFPHTPMEVLYIPLSLRTIEDSEHTRKTLREELQTPQDSVVILHATRMHRIKGHQRFLCALRELKKLPNWICWIAGGPQRPEEESYFRGLQIMSQHFGIEERVRFIGDRNDLSRVFPAADIYCQPNTKPETFGVTFIEALSAGVPVVTTAFGGALEILNESCGILTDSGDKELVDALQTLILDPEKRRMLGKNGPGRAAELCSCDKQLVKLANLLQPLLPDSVKREILLG